MSRTIRKYMTDANYREARKGRFSARRKSGTKTATLIADGWYVIEHGIIRSTLWKDVPGGKDRPKDWGKRNRRGGMLMSPSNSGVYRDEQGGIRMKRALKRGERQETRDEMWNEVSEVD